VALIWSGSSLLGKIKGNSRRGKSKDLEIRLEEPKCVENS